MLSDKDRMLAQDFVDGRLDPAACREVEQRLAQDPALQAEVDLLLAVSSAAHDKVSRVEVPDDLEARVLETLDREDRSYPVAEPVRTVGFGWWKPAFVAVAAALLLMVISPFDLSSEAGDITEAVAEDFERYVSKKINPCFSRDDCTTIREFFASKGMEFDPATLDRPLDGFTFAHGAIDTIEGKPSAMFCYETDDQEVVICEMFTGDLEDLPEALAVRNEAGVPVLVYEVGGLTMAFWEEQSMVCVMTSNIDGERVVQLALHKAAMSAGS